MRVGILAAGIGQRLNDRTLPPKILLPFGGETLLARHIAILRRCGVSQVDLVVGYRAEEIEAELTRIGAEDMVTTRQNVDFSDGSIVSFWTLQEAFKAGESVVFMDGDVLYDQRLMMRLLNSTQTNCFLMDRITEEGEDPVKLCMRDDVLVDFHKRPQLEYDWWGEWIGFCRFDPEMAQKVWAAADRHISAGRRGAIYEDAIRDVLLAEPPGTFGTEDITGLPWVEIDFPDDLKKAKRDVFPSLLDLPSDQDLPRVASDAAR
ncbi:MAG: phosphocholine cytidylyltransferase family protein [Alphaproteobacteria bacterium]